VSEQDARLAAIASSTTDAIIGKDLDGIITSWNPAAEKIFGYGAEQALGRPATMLYAPETMSEEIELLERIGRGETVANRQTRLLRKDGSTVDVSISLAPIHAQSGKVSGAAMIGRDITAQLAMQTDAERLAALRGAILDSMSYSIITTTPEGLITSFNHAAERILGYSAGEVIGKHTPAIFRDPDELAAAVRARGGTTPPGTPDSFEVIVSDARRGVSSEREWRYVRKDGHRFPGLLSITALRNRDGSVTGFLGILKDISEHRAAEAAAAREAEKIRTILDNAIEGIHILDEDGRLVFYSQSFARMLGRTPEQMSGIGVRDWDHNPLTDNFRAAIATLMHAPLVFETRHHRLDGALFDVEISAKGIQLEGKSYLYAASRDITERLRVERDRQRYLLQLEQTNKDLDDFVSVASHDLRAPLRAASSLAQWIVEDNPDADAVTRERLGLIQARMRRMGRLLDDILQYARVGRSQAERSELMPATAVLKQVLALLEVPATMQVLADDSLAGVQVPRVPLQQVLANLIDNAIKHHDRPTGTISVAVALRAGALRFAVTDDGPGVPEHYREEIFEMFKTLKPRDEIEGSGMGLALVRKIVAQSGGRCGVEPAPARGSVFWFDWPLPASARETAHDLK
jgi:PAS domain S-box-containing protein